MRALDHKLVPMMFKYGLLREHELHEILTREKQRSMADVVYEAEMSIQAEEAGYEQN